MSHLEQAGIDQPYCIKTFFFFFFINDVVDIHFVPFTSLKRAELQSHNWDVSGLFSLLLMEM